MGHGAVAKWKRSGLQNLYERVRFPPAPQREIENYNLKVKI